MKRTILMLALAGLVSAPAAWSQCEAGAGGCGEGKAKAFPGWDVAQKVSKGDWKDSKIERDYERGRRAIDKRQWDEALAHFDEVIAGAKSNADAAMYWKAFALAKLGRSADATAALNNLAKLHAQSRWLPDAKALQVEIAQAAGRPVQPESADDDELKLMALNSLMHSEPSRSVPLLEKLLERRSSPQIQERALFILSQSEDPKARTIVMKLAEGAANPDLQMKAIRNLGVYGSKSNRDALASIFASAKDTQVKIAVLSSFRIAGDRDRVLQAAKSDANPEIRKSAIQMLGTMGGMQQLGEMYDAEQSPEVRLQIVRALFVGGAAPKLIAIAQNEKDPKVRLQAIQQLGVMPSASTGAALQTLYAADHSEEVRKAVMRGLFVQGSAKQLVEIARKETNPELRKTAVQHLSVMRSKEATDYLMELLK